MDSIFQVFALSFKEPGAIEFFSKNLPKYVVRSHGKGYGELYDALLEFYDKTGVDIVDVVSFTSWAKQETSLVDVLGGDDGFRSALEEILKRELSNPKAVTGLLRYWYNKDVQKEKVEQLQKALNGGDAFDATKIDSLARDIQDLNRSGADPLRSVFNATMMADKAESLWELPDFLSTPFKALNQALGYDVDKGGICKGAVSSILAQSGQGKSSFARTLAVHWADQGHTVLYVNYEESISHWERVFFTQVTGFNIYRSNEIDDTQKKHYTKLFKDKMREWNGRFLAKHDPDTPYFEDLEDWLRDIASKGTVPDAIIIDTIQSMFLKHGKSLPRWGQYEEMMVRLEKLAKDLHCAIIITAQENSNRMKDKREVVQQSDAGGSLSIMQKSSVAIFITRAKLSIGDDSIDEHLMQLQIPKNRITGTMSMMDPPLVMYDDTTKSYKDVEMPAADSRMVDAESYEDFS